MTRIVAGMKWPHFQEGEHCFKIGQTGHIFFFLTNRFQSKVEKL